MPEIVYRSEVRIERVKGPVRRAYLPAESQPVTFGVHGAVAEHYKASGGFGASRDDVGLHCRRSRRLTYRNLWRRAGGASNRCIGRPARLRGDW